jgi:hypothetical protein
VKYPGVGFAALIVLTVGGAATSTAAPADDSLRPRYDGLDEVRALALQVSRKAGEPHPSDAVLFSTTRSTAMRLVARSTADSDFPVYTVIMRGNFTLPRKVGPPPGQTVRGTEMYFTWAPADRKIWDFGISYGYPRPAQLGPGVSLD